MENTDFFKAALAAPDTIPLWFKHDNGALEEPLKPNHNWPGFVKSLSEDYATIVDKNYNDESSLWEGLTIPPNDLVKKVADFEAEWNEYFDKKSAYEYQDKINRYFQWRMFYAKHLLFFTAQNEF